MKSLRHKTIRSRCSPGQRSSQQLARRSKRLLLGRVISLSVLTGLGWAVVSSVGLSSASIDWRLPGRLGDRPSQMASPSAGLSADIMPGLGRLQPIPSFQSVAKADDIQAAELTGNRIRLNGQTLTGFWQQKNGRFGISSSSLASLMGVELLSTTVPAQQPIRWFPTQADPLVLPAWWDATNRYIDITNLVASAGWTAQAAGTTLDLTLPQSRVNGVRQGRQTWGDRIVVDLTGPATWQMEAADGYTVTIDGAITPQMVAAFRALPGNLITQLDVAALGGHTGHQNQSQRWCEPSNLVYG